MSYHNCLRYNYLVACLAIMIISGVVLSIVIGVLMLRSTVQGHASSSNLKLIIDTDAGVDDAVAISLALGAQEHQPDNFNILAITTVTGNTAVDNVVLNVLKILKTADRLDIPLYRGAENSILRTPESDDFFGKDGFNDIDFPDVPDPNVYLQKEHAVTGLINIVKENPGEVTLVCLGPLTNIALAIRQDPGFLNYTKRVVVLGGAVEGRGNVKPGIEFNFFFDPIADYIVLESSSATNPVTLMPLETFSIRNDIAQEWREEVLGAVDSSLVELLNKAEAKFFNSSENWELTADPFAMAVALNEDLITLQTEYYVQVETSGSNGGLLTVDYSGKLNKPPNADTVINIDVDGFKNFLVENLS